MDKKFFTEKKRLLSLLLVITMMFSIMPGMTYAAKADNTSTTENIEDNFEDYATGGLDEKAYTLEELYSKDDDAVSNEELIDSIIEDNEDNNEAAYELDGDTYPSHVDNSTSKYFPKVDSQEYIGSCTCWAEVYYAFTYATCRANDIEATDDKIMSPAFIYNQIKAYDGGSSFFYALNLLMHSGAPYKDTADFESYYNEYACKTWFPEKSIWEEATNNRLADYAYVGTPDTITSPKDSDLDELKSYLSNGCLVTFSTNISGWSYANIPSGSDYAGEYIVKSSSGGATGHRMTIVGYDDNIFIDLNGNGTIEEAEKGAFKIANSWGDDYRNDGFIWLAYDSLNSTSQAGVNNYNRYSTMCNYAVQYVDSTVKKASDVNMVLTLNTSDRRYNKILINATKTDDSGTDYVYSTVGANRLSYSLDGADYATDGTIVYDLNNVIPGITKDNVKDYTWTVTASDTYSNSKYLTLMDAYIEADGNEVLEITPDYNAIDGSDKTYTFTNSTFKVKDFTISNSNPTILDKVNLAATVSGGSGDYSYTFGAVHNGTTYYFPMYDHSYNTYELSLAYPSIDYPAGSNALVGSNTLFVTVTDNVTGETASKNIYNYNVEGLKITDFSVTPDSDDFYVNEKVHLSVSVENEYYYRYNTKQFSYTHNGVTTTIPVYSGSSGYSESFTPTETGTYTVTYYIRDCIGQEATVSKTINVVDKNTLLTVYYSNSSWGNGVANIHYCVDGSSWTDVPSVKMQGSDIKEYTWKYVIDLGDANGAQICFNNGNGLWDNNNNSNYYLTAGTYGIKNGVVNDASLKVSVSIDREVGGIYNNSKITAKTENGTPVQYKFLIYKAGSARVIGPGTVFDSSQSEASYNWTPYSEGTYTLEVEVIDNRGNITSGFINNYVVEGPKFNYFTTDKPSSQSVGTEITLSTSFVNFQPDQYNSYSFTISDGTTSTTLYPTVTNPYSASDSVATATWIPTEAGTYTLTAVFAAYTGARYTTSMEYVITDSNAVTVYYNNSNWSTANIHYCVDGLSWTNVPGVSMQASDKAGYTWKYVIDLGSANGAQVCFNNGNNWWDSRNGSNYYLTKGTYAIENGNVTTIS